MNLYLPCPWEMPLTQMKPTLVWPPSKDEWIKCSPECTCKRLQVVVPEYLKVLTQMSQQQIRQEYKQFVERSGIQFDFTVGPEEGNNKLVTSGIQDALLLFHARRNHLTDPRIIQLELPVIILRIKSHREYLASKERANGRPQEVRTQATTNVVRKGRRTRVSYHF